MSALDHTRRLTRMLAVLLGVLLWWPAPGLELERADQPSVSAADAGQRADGTFEYAGDNPSEASEGEDSEVEDGSVDQLALVSPMHVATCVPTRLELLGHERPGLSSGYDVLARERGPPAA